MESNTQNMEMGWDDAIMEDGQQFLLLDEGDYDFTVAGFERARHAGSDKIPPCNKAVVSLLIDTPNGSVVIKVDILLYRTLEWRISSFFRSIGQKKHGERLVMDWSKVPGAKGRAHIKVREYTDKWNTIRKRNEVAYFIDREDAPVPAAVQSDDSDIPF